MAVKKQAKPKPKQLGKPTPIPVSPADALLERVANPHPETLYAARFTAPEFTCLCPITGQPDFAHFLLQPMDQGALKTADNVRAAIDYCLAHPKWRLSLQTHKLLGLR